MVGSGSREDGDECQIKIRMDFGSKLLENYLQFKTIKFPINRIISNWNKLTFVKKKLNETTFVVNIHCHSIVSTEEDN